MKRFYADNLLESTCLYPGVASTLAELQKQNLRLAVVTNKVADATVTILEALGIAGYFCDIIGGDDIYPLKPEPDSLLALQQKYNLDAKDCWMIGDNYTDLEAGRRAGFRRIFCTYGFGFKTNCVPSFEAESFDVLTGVLL
jgi:phosphoglycolate phosphatase